MMAKAEDKAYDPRDPRKGQRTVNKAKDKAKAMTPKIFIIDLRYDDKFCEYQQS